MLTVKDLHKSYQTPAGDLPVLKGIAFQLEAGESASIMGPSGCGKSTLLQIIGALDAPTSGTVSLEGVNPFALPEPEQALYRNTRIGFVFQDHCLLPQLSVMENVLTPLLVGPRDPEAPDRARQLLDEVGLSSRLDHRPSELSGGEKQRVAIARALIRKPRLLLCDEPTGNLDQDSAETISQLLAQTRTSHNATVITVTHSPSLAQRFQRRYTLKGGTLVDA